MISEFLDHPALADYYSRLQAVKAQGFKNESQTQRAFSYLLTALSEERKWTFVAETPLDGPVDVRELHRVSGLEPGAIVRWRWWRGDDPERSDAHDPNTGQYNLVRERARQIMFLH